MGLSRGKPPPLADVDLWRVKHVPPSPGKSPWLEARVLAEPEWIETHFVPGHGGMPHLDANCSWCHHGKPRSYCYLPVSRIKSEEGRPVWGRSVLELPAEVAGLLPATTGRGSVIEVLRQADKSYRVRTKDTDRSLAATLLPTFDVIEVLLRYWRLTRADLEAGPVDQPDTIRFPGRKIG